LSYNGICNKEVYNTCFLKSCGKFHSKSKLNSIGGKKKYRLHEKQKRSKAKLVKIMGRRCEIGKEKAN